MLNISPSTRIFICDQFVDFRKGIDGLAAICRNKLDQDPLQGALFIFRNRARSASKTDISARAIVSLLKYRGGVPFYRQEQIQEVLGAPISASEIWEMTRDAAQAVQPIYGAICKTAANAELIHNDDTKAQILSRSKELKKIEEESKRKGTFTSAIVAVLKDSGIKVGLFFY